MTMNATKSLMPNFLMTPLLTLFDPESSPAGRRGWIMKNHEENPKSLWLMPACPGQAGA
jgi:hypothetical protein